MGANRSYSIKQGGTLKDVDLKSRTVTGYFASFHTLDSDGDVFRKGAFSRSIKNNKDRILHLLMHDPSQPIGRPSILKEDSTGVYFETTIAETQLGDDVLALYRDGTYNEHSVGFEMLKSEPDQEGTFGMFSPRYSPENKRPANVITEVRMWEGSTVSWGANHNTPFLGFKDSDEQRSKAIERTERIYKALHRGNLSDETYQLLEIELKQLQTLLAQAPAVATPPAPKKDFEPLLKELSTLQNLVK